MDIFRYHNPNNPTLLESGELVEGFKTKMWVERYAKEGEFRLTALATSGMREKLPIGCMISHINSPEVMIVENHEINETKDTESEIVITGRSFETYLDNRIVGSNITIPRGGIPPAFELGAFHVANQIVYLINNFISTPYLIDDDNALDYVVPTSTFVDTGIMLARTVAVGSLYERVKDLLSIENLGIKTIRPGPFWNLWAAYIPDNIYLALVVHKGVDQSSKVTFSYDTGEIVDADYLWSNKAFKNAALVYGKWVSTEVIPAATKYDRRWMIIDATDIDQDYEAVTVDDVDDISDKMQQRGIDILRYQNSIAMTKADVSQENTKALFREDFDVGDLITVRGDYNEVSKMRVSEYVEIEDETGERGYPTLVIDGEDI